MADVSQSWVKYPETSHFPIQNIPFGVFEKAPGVHHCGVAIGDRILDLYACVSKGLFDHCKWDKEVLLQPTLNGFMALGRPAWRECRTICQRLLGKGSTLANDPNLQAACMVDQAKVRMVMPANIGDYTDFYSSRYHATNVGKMFRPNEAALKPNWVHLPVGYHGRASSVVVSGTPITRPQGQLRPNMDKPPVHGPCRLLDFELEMAFFVGPGNKMGQPIKVENAEDHIFGLVLMNDWSARDIQKWEYVPLGPFNGKNFATTISPWIVTLDALEQFACDPEKQNPEVLPYLQDPKLKSYDINLEVAITPTKSKETTVVSKSNAKYLYWSFTQQLAHHSSTGCPTRPGDLLGSGTISGPEPGSYGSMLEICWKGTKPVKMNDGSERKFIADGDDVQMTGFCQGKGFRVGFGPCNGVLRPKSNL